jgi:hypothetical protein
VNRIAGGTLNSMHEETVVALGDLQFVCIECPHCKTRVILDMEQKFEFSGGIFFAPETCPGCRKPFDSAIPASLNALQRAYLAVPKPLRPAITFQKRIAPPVV